MPVKFWNDKRDQILRRMYPDTFNDVIAELLGVTPKAIKSRAKVLGVRKIRKMNPRDLRYRIDLEEFKQIFPSTSSTDLMKKYGASESSIRNLARSLNLVKDPDVQKRTQFKKEHNPWNAGKHICHSPGSVFPKGNLPVNTLYDGAITIRTDTNPKTGYSRTYKYIRIRKGIWELYHRYLWEKLKGPIPGDSLILFKDGDSLNCVIDNLECITKRENARRNHNRQKAAISNKSNWEEEINDRQVAAYIVGSDKELQDEIINNNKELIALKRAQFKFNKSIKNEKRRG